LTCSALYAEPGLSQKATVRPASSNTDMPIYTD
jgi:hypothetical protein